MQPLLPAIGDAAVVFWAKTSATVSETQAAAAEDWFAQTFAPTPTDSDEAINLRETLEAVAAGGDIAGQPDTGPASCFHNVRLPWCSGAGRMAMVEGREATEADRITLAQEESSGLRGVTLGTAGALCSIALIGRALITADTGLTTFFFVKDLISLLIIGAVLIAANSVAAFALLGRWSALAARPRSAGLALSAIIGVVTLIGTSVIYHGFALSYDEVMAEFDAKIFRTGTVIHAVPSEWRPYLAALAPHFLLPVPGNDAWVSAYLPVNAMMRALFACVWSPTLTGPVLAAIAVAAIVGVARRLWPDRPDAAIVAALLLATAPQVLITAMTPYAMTGHLALNLVWLWLFLRGGRIGHAGSAVVGFLACGLHQVIFHPLFVAPFVVGLLLRRRWRLAAFYVAAYAGIGAFWTFYWQGLLAATGYGANGGAAAAAAVGGAFQLARVLALLSAFDWAGLDLMAKNLVRYVTWQSPLLVPLVLLSWPALRRGEGTARALAAGIVLTTLAMFVLLPYQGHGWGYRYLHGLIGSACLLAAQGWVILTRAASAARLAAARAAFGFACAAALLVMLPLRAEQVERFVAPYAAASAAIRGLPADIVLVDDRALAFGSDLVRNAPSLDNRPILLLRRAITSDAELQAVCARGSVAVFGAAEASRLGLAIVNADAEAAGRPTPNPCASGVNVAQ